MADIPASTDRCVVAALYALASWHWLRKQRLTQTVMERRSRCPKWAELARVGPLVGIWNVIGSEETVALDIGLQTEYEGLFSPALHQHRQFRTRKTSRFHFVVDSYQHVRELVFVG